MQALTIEALALVSAPFRGSVMQVLVVGSGYGWPGVAKQPVNGPLVLRAATKHFDTHLDFELTNFVSALPVEDSHFSSSFVCPGIWASTGDAARHRPAAAAAANDASFTLSSIWCLPLLFCCSSLVVLGCWDGRADAPPPGAFLHDSSIGEHRRYDQALFSNSQWTRGSFIERSARAPHASRAQHARSGVKGQPFR